MERTDRRVAPRFEVLGGLWGSVEMLEPMRSAILELQVGETSPPIESKGLIHLFKRIP